MVYQRAHEEPNLIGDPRQLLQVLQEPVRLPGDGNHDVIDNEHDEQRREEGEDSVPTERSYDDPEEDG